MYEVGRDGHGELEGTMGGNREEARGVQCRMDVYKQENAKKTNQR